jgi:predicted nucleic acid-binding Zn ribbon protein
MRKPSDALAAVHVLPPPGKCAWCAKPAPAGSNYCRACIAVLKVENRREANEELEAIEEARAERERY